MRLRPNKLTFVVPILLLVGAAMSVISDFSQVAALSIWIRRVGAAGIGGFLLPILFLTGALAMKKQRDGR